ncbi:MAG: isoaspartyl peptidase/L-asparaginase, partial [Abyssibacter sp.]
MTHHPVSFAIHGGAGDMPDRDHGYADHLAALQAIGVSTRQALADGADAIDAVELAVRQLEDCELFNAGRGAVLNADGDAELDASIMRGDGACGAVAGVRRPRNPIGL